MSMKKLLSRSLVLCAIAVSTFTAQADEGGLLGARYGGEDRGKPLRPAQVSAKWQQECSACHLAFPPGLLPAESWSKLVAGLDRHFGVDASLTPAEAGEVGTFLTSNASNRWSAKTAPLRITESGWFKAKHNEREVAAAVWSRAAVKGRWNCEACHAGAPQADFNEHAVRIPK